MWAQFLNETCRCVSPDRTRLPAAIRHPTGPSEPEREGSNSSAFFADFPVFVDAQTVARIEGVVAAVDALCRLPAFQTQALAASPQIAGFDQGTSGLLHGFDFHLTEQGPQLIEINTNAGGVLLNAGLADAQRACCDAVQPFVSPAGAWGATRTRLIDAFRSELVAGPSAAEENRELRAIAIVDEQPQTQFLFPEFQLFAQLFEDHGVAARIVDPRQLEHRDGRLWCGDTAIDLVYNRLTDFYFESDATRALRDAYLANDVVVTPSPRHHALLANKRHLVTLSDAEALRRMGLSRSAIDELVPFVPAAELVERGNGEDLWRRRRGLFFKPLTGFGSRAAYRGDKLTRRRFDEILAGEYLAQRIVAPSERTIVVDGEPAKLKLDVRAYVAERRIISLAARLYRGQTTNFRTSGGGFATVLAVPEVLEHLTPAPFPPTPR